MRQASRFFSDTTPDRSTARWVMVGGGLRGYKQAERQKKDVVWHARDAASRNQQDQYFQPSFFDALSKQ